MLETDLNVRFLRATPIRQRHVVDHTSVGVLHVELPAVQLHQSFEWHTGLIGTRADALNVLNVLWNLDRLSTRRVTWPECLDADLREHVASETR